MLAMREFGLLYLSLLVMLYSGLYIYISPGSINWKKTSLSKLSMLNLIEILNRF